MKQTKGRGRNGKRRLRSKAQAQALALGGAASDRQTGKARAGAYLRPKSVARSPFSSSQSSQCAMSRKIAERRRALLPLERSATLATEPISTASVTTTTTTRAAAPAAAASAVRAKRRASRPSEGVRNEIEIIAKRLKHTIAKHTASTTGANVGLAAAGRHMSATETHQRRDVPMSANVVDIGRSLANNEAQQGAANEMDFIKSASRAHSWHWNDKDRSHECVVSDDKLEVCFHPQCSESAAAIRGSEPLSRNGNYYYWEVTVFDKAYGTSVMFGVCTKEQKLHANDYCNLVGLDREGWSLSHKGLIWHNTKMSQYTNMFPTNQSVTLGILFNTMRGELSFFMNGKNLGVAFCELNKVSGELYPVIGSTAKCTRMRLNGAYCGYVSLMERSCFTILRSARDRNELVRNLHQYRVPKNLIRYLAEAAEVCGSQTETTAQLDQYQLEC